MDRPITPLLRFSPLTNFSDEKKRIRPTNFGFFLIFTLLCACAMIFFGANPRISIIHSRIFKPQTWAFSKEERKYSKSTTTCFIPQLNPFDPSILKFYKPKKYERVHSTKYPLLFTTDLNTTLKRVGDPKKYGYFSCCYSSFKRVHWRGERVKVSKKCQPILKNATIIPENIQFIQISCATSKYGNASRSRRIVDILPFIRVKHFKAGDLAQFNKAVAPSALRSHGNQGIKQHVTKARKKLNVVIFGIDSVSHMNFIRTMPKTYSYLTNNLSAIDLWGYTKVGDNTFPNVVPLLTGLFIRELQSKAHCWDWKPWTPFDRCPFIWKKYSEAGFVTSYGEDALNIGIFNYMKGGFQKQPTDSYLNAMTNWQMNQTGNNCTNRRMITNVCYGPRLSFEILLNYVKEMAHKMSSKQASRPYFQFIWSTALTHDKLNMGKLGDEYLLETLQWLQNGFHLQDTFLILMSDHGIQAGKFRQMMQGRVENRMPFVYLLLPPWFRAEYPEAVQNLVENQHKLTTSFDTYKTLLDLLNLKSLSDESIRYRTKKLKRHQPKKSSTLTKSVQIESRGLSLFLPIPSTRTCKEADIDPMWCLCRDYKMIENVGKNNTFVREGAKIVVKAINHRLKRSPKCQKLFLKNVLYAQVAQDLQHKEAADEVLTLSTILSATDPRLSRANLTLFISLRVAPSNANFEATLRRYSNGKWLAVDELSRTDRYGAQGWCTTEVRLRMFCYC